MACSVPEETDGTLRVDPPSTVCRTSSRERTVAIVVNPRLQSDEAPGLSLAVADLKHTNASVQPQRYRAVQRSTTLRGSACLTANRRAATLRVKMPPAAHVACSAVKSARKARRVQRVQTAETSAVKLHFCQLQGEQDPSKRRASVQDGGLLELCGAVS
ncbi:hypothetical protein ON010_g4937 [Phytophthora cinnamomi]|nr:hypothetical protein ON010_g4937 [Phytophthora cinnamomi]